jgi:hypothetical protein
MKRLIVKCGWTIAFVLVSVMLTWAQAHSCTSKTRYELGSDKKEIKRLKARINEFIYAYYSEDFEDIIKVLPATSADEKEYVTRRYLNSFARGQIHGIENICIDSVSKGYPHYFAVARGTVLYTEKGREPEGIFFYISKSNDNKVRFVFTVLMFTKSDTFELAPTAPRLP